MSSKTKKRDKTKGTGQAAYVNETPNAAEDDAPIGAAPEGSVSDATESTNDQAATPKRKKRSVNEVLVGLLTRKADQHQDHLDGMGASTNVLRGAVKQLRESGHDDLVPAIEDYCGRHTLQLYPTRGGGGAKKPPIAGERRVYKTQSLKDGMLYLRMPVGFLGVTKGSPIEVFFDDKTARMVLEPARVGNQEAA